jgi:hypothetical protein
VAINTGSVFDSDLGSTYHIDPLFTAPTYFGDMNGDGLVDLIESRDSSRKVYINRGNNTGWWEDSNYVVPFAFPEGGAYVADVNNDGLAGVVVSAATTTSMQKVYINKGDGTGWEEDANYSIPVFIWADGDKGVPGRRHERRVP